MKLVIGLFFHLCSALRQVCLSERVISLCQGNELCLLFFSFRGAIEFKMLKQVVLKKLKCSSASKWHMEKFVTWIAPNWTYLEQNSLPEHSVKIRVQCGGGECPSVFPSNGTENNIGMWSDKPGSPILMFNTDRPRDRIKSKVCPWTWVGPDTHCTKSKESIRLRKSCERGLESQHTWILKSPRIRILSWLVTISARNSANSLIKLLFAWGGRYIITKTTGFTRESWNSWTSKLLHVWVDKQWQRWLFLNTVANPPPRPDKRGELRKLQPYGNSSVNGLKSPGLIQVSVMHKISKVCKVKKSFNIKVLFTRERALIKATFSSFVSSWSCVDLCNGRRLEVFTPQARRRGGRRRVGIERVLGITGRSHRCDVSSGRQSARLSRVIGKRDSLSADGDHAPVLSECGQAHRSQTLTDGGSAGDLSRTATPPKIINNFHVFSDASFSKASQQDANIGILEDKYG